MAGKRLYAVDTWIRGDTGMDGVVRGDALGPSTVFDELHYPGLTYMPSLRSTKGAMGRSAYARGRSLYQGGRLGKRVRVHGGMEE